MPVELPPVVVGDEVIPPEDVGASVPDVGVGAGVNPVTADVGEIVPRDGLGLFGGSLV